MTAEKVPFGTKQVVILGLEDRASGDDRFAPIGILAASSGGSNVPSLSVVPEMPETDGGTDRFIPNVLAITTQEKAVQTTDVIAQHVAATPYGYDPAQTLLSQRIIKRGTGGSLNDSTTNYVETPGTNDDGERFGLDTRSFLYGQHVGNPALGRRLRCTGSGALFSNIADSISSTADVTGVGTTATLIKGVASSRIAIIITNLDSTNNARIGDGNITVTRGHRLKPGESIKIKTAAAISGLAETGTVSFSILELI